LICCFSWANSIACSSDVYAFSKFQSITKKDGTADVLIVDRKKQLLSYVVNVIKNEKVDSYGNKYGAKVFFITDPERGGYSKDNYKNAAYVTPNHEVATAPIFDSIKDLYDHTEGDLHKYYLSKITINNQEVSMLTDINFNIIRFSPILGDKKHIDYLYNADGTVATLPLTPIYERKEGECFDLEKITQLYKQSKENEYWEESELFQR